MNDATVLICCRALFEETQIRQARGTGPQRHTTEQQRRWLRIQGLRGRFSKTTVVGTSGLMLSESQ